MNDKLEDFEIDLSDFDSQVEENPAPTTMMPTGADPTIPTGNLPALPDLPSLEGKRMTDYIKFKPELMAKIPEAAKRIPLDDANAIIMYGMNFQKAYLDQLKGLLDNSKIGDLTPDTQRTVKQIGLAIDLVPTDAFRARIAEFKNIKSAKSLLGFLSGFFSIVKDLNANKKKLSKLLDDIEEDIQKTLMKIADNNARINVAVKETKKNYFMFGFHIAAAEERLIMGKNEFLLLQEEAAKGNVMDHTELIVLKDHMIMLQSRNMALKAGFVESPMAVEEMLAQQKAGVMQMVSLMNTMFTTMPTMVRNFLQIVTLLELKEAQMTQKQLSELGDKLDQGKSELLHEVVTNARKMMYDFSTEVNRVARKCEDLKKLGADCAEIDRQGAKMMEKQEEIFAYYAEDFEKSQKQAAQIS